MNAPLSLPSLFRAAVSVLLSISFTIPAVAGQFSITPVRIYMAPKDKAVAVTLTNEGDEPLVMQADLYLWQQKPNGEDDLMLTEDLFLSPPIIKLAPKAKQVVRLARLSRAIPPEQLTYRIIVREIPEAKPPVEGVQIPIAMAMSLPVFITPSSAKSKLDCSVHRLSAESITVSCENIGSAYAQPREILISNLTGETLLKSEPAAYILPGTRRSYDLKRESASIPSGKAKLTITLDDATKQSFDVTISE